MEDKDWVQKALRNLRPDNPNWYGWAKTDSSGNIIPNNQRMCYEHEISIQDGVTKPTQEEFNTEFQRLKNEYNSTEYKRNRAHEYPEIGDQLDDLFKAGAFSTEMSAKIQAVKDKYPKE